MSDKPSITSVAEDVISLARAAGKAIVTVESCSAGALATLLADVPGSGDVLVGGFVCYAKAGKVAMLGIDPSLLAKHTAVSAEVARSLAAAALARCEPAQIAIAITCVGGPLPDDDGNPIGRVHIALQDRNGRIVQSHTELGHDSAGRIRGEVLLEALLLARTSLLDDARDGRETLG